jgi:hypothetical protein
MLAAFVLGDWRPSHDSKWLFYRGVMKHIAKIAWVVLGTLALAACGKAPTAAPTPTAAADTSEPVAPATEVTVWPASLNVFGDGYPNAGDPCRRVGESAATIDFLDDSAILVGCIGDAATESAAAIIAAGGKAVGRVDGVTLISIPQGDANVGMKPE